MYFLFHLNKSEGLYRRWVLDVADKKALNQKLSGGVCVTVIIDPENKTLSFGNFLKHIKYGRNRKHL